MELDLYQNITNEAIDRIENYVDTEEKEGRTLDPENKESYLAYWLCLVAYEKGKGIESEFHGRKDVKYLN